MLPITPLALVGLMAALEELYLDSEFASAWALAHISAGNTSPWLIDLLDSGGIRDASAAAAAGYHALDFFFARIDDVSLHLGFGFLLYLDAKRSATELLTSAGELTDCRGYSYPSCEAFYALLDPVECRAPTPPWTARLNALFGSHAALARQAEAELRAGWTTPT